MTFLLIKDRGRTAVPANASFEKDTVWHNHSDSDDVRAPHLSNKCQRKSFGTAMPLCLDNASVDFIGMLKPSVTAAYPAQPHWVNQSDSIVESVTTCCLTTDFFFSLFFFSSSIPTEIWGVTTAAPPEQRGRQEEEEKSQSGGLGKG